MIINTLKYLFSVISALYFVFAGAGYNVVDYCCEDCAREGIDFVAHHSCVSVHHEKSHDCCDLHPEKHVETPDHQAYLQTCSHDNSCLIVRVQLDDFSVVERISNTNNPDENLFIEFAEDVFLRHDFNNYVFHALYSPPDFSVNSGREILSNKSVLII
jgi:hypothetical protein